MKAFHFVDILRISKIIIVIDLVTATKFLLLTGNSNVVH